MPSLDSFQNVQLKDEKTMECFLLAHRMRHIQYAQSAALQGVSADAQAYLAGPVDNNWFLAHANAHQTLQVFYTPTQSVDITVLSLYTWDNQQDFDTWMFPHTGMHRLLDQAFGIFS
jgi:hypothetical protein